MMVKNIGFLILVVGLLIFLPSARSVTNASIHSNADVNCTAFVDDANCSRLTCSDSRIEDKSCPPSYIEHPEPFIQPSTDKPCIKYGFYDDYKNDVWKEVCLGDYVIVKGDNIYCTAYMTSSGCAESFCTMGLDHYTLCASENPSGMSGFGSDDAPEQTNDTSCKVQYDQDKNCLTLLCGGYKKDVCVDKVASQYTAESVEANTTIMFGRVEVIKITLENISLTYTTLNAKAIALASYYSKNGDQENANKYTDLASKFSEIALMINELEDKTISKSSTVADLNELTQGEKEDILSDVQAIVQKMDVTRIMIQ